LVPLALVEHKEQLVTLALAVLLVTLAHRVLLE
jgi:hypothetical protein